jgi:hypothetical protein
MMGKDELWYWIDARNDDELPDGAWWSVLEEAVVDYNEEYGTDYDPFDAVHAYLNEKDA